MRRLGMAYEQGPIAETTSLIVKMIDFVPVEAIEEAEG